MGEDDLYLTLTPAHQAVPHRDSNLPHDHHIQVQEEVVDHCDRSFQAVFQGDDSIVQVALFHRLQDPVKVLEITQAHRGHAL